MSQGEQAEPPRGEADVTIGSGRLATRSPIHPPEVGPSAPRLTDGGGKGPKSLPQALAGTGVSTRTRWVIALGITLVALNLRPAVSALGPFLAEVRAGLGLSGAVLGLLTSVPALCFALFGSLAPRMARRFGPLAVVVGAMFALAIGLLLRALAGGPALFLLTTALALAGIAVGNVLLPVVVKRWFPDRVGTMTGLYSTAMAVGTAAAAALSVPLTHALGAGWRVGLGMWAILPVAAVLPFAFVLVRRRGVPDAGGVSSTDPAPRAPIQVTKSPTAWALALFFGLQATAAYVVIGWLPQIFRDAGLSAQTAGALLAVAMGMGIPLSFVLPRVATMLSHQGPLVVLLGVCGLAGYAGLFFAPVSAPWVWVILVGVSNCAFPLALTMIGMRARTGAGVAKLSAFAQSAGYLLSIPGPLVVGVLHDATDSWSWPLLLMAGLLTLQMIVGVVAGRHRFVEDDGEVRH